MCFLAWIEDGGQWAPWGSPNLGGVVRRPPLVIYGSSCSCGCLVHLSWWGVSDLLLHTQDPSAQEKEYTSPRIPWFVHLSATSAASSELLSCWILHSYESINPCALHIMCFFAYHIDWTPRPPHGGSTDPLCGPTVFALLHLSLHSNIYSVYISNQVIYINKVTLCLIPFICDILLTILTIQNHDKMIINTMLTPPTHRWGHVAKSMGGGSWDAKLHKPPFTNAKPKATKLKVKPKQTYSNSCTGLHSSLFVCLKSHDWK